jgi:hypothetical protein
MSLQFEIKERRYFLASDFRWKFLLIILKSLKIYCKRREIMSVFPSSCRATSAQQSKRFCSPLTCEMNEVYDFTKEESLVLGFSRENSVNMLK